MYPNTATTVITYIFQQQRAGYLLHQARSATTSLFHESDKTGASQSINDDIYCSID
jgi:hypothetical protein